MTPLGTVSVMVTGVPKTGFDEETAGGGRTGVALTMVTVVAALFFLLIMFSLSMTDYLTRSWLTY